MSVAGYLGLTLASRHPVFPLWQALTITSIASRWFRSRHPHAIAVGVLWALAFPEFDIAGAAWVVPGLMVAVAAGTDGRQAFRLGFLAGFAAHLVSLYWLLLIPVPFFPILGWLALSGYVALYPAVWLWLAHAWWKHFAKAGPAKAGMPGWLGRVGWPNMSRRLQWSFLGACAWVALEWLRAHFLGGFPWNLLAVSQAGMIPLIQVASVTGIYGVSFLVVWFSLGFYCAMLKLLHAPGRSSIWLGDLAVPLLVVIGLFGWGWLRVREAPEPDRFLRVAVIQPSIPQTMIWDSSANAERFEEVLALTHQALAEQPDLLLWPEAAVPELLRWDEATYETVTGLARSNRIWMVLGADDAVPGDTPESEPLYFNSAWLVSPQGVVLDTYRKQKLVAFGEEIPFIRWLPFLKWLTPITGSFTRGTGPVTFITEDPQLHMAPSICFEDVFPALTRRSVLADTDLLVNLTNDGWFGEGAAQRQQAASAVLRAVENGLPVVRCTNNGLTCWVDPFGRMVETFVDEDGRIFGPGWAIFTVELRDTSPGRTPYHRQGDLFATVCAAFSLLAAFRCRRAAKLGKA